MRQQTKDSIARTTLKAFGFSAGDLVVYIDPEEDRHLLLTLQRTESNDADEGLEIDASGIRAQEERTLRFHRGYLEAEGIEKIHPTGHFEIDDERWDLADGSPIVVKTGPIAGSHPIVRAKVRKSVERNRSIPGSEFGYAE